MLWVFLSLCTAFFESLKDVFSKKGLQNIDEYVVTWSASFFSCVFLLPLLFFVEIPVLGDSFWSALLVSGSLNAVAVLLFMKAINQSDLSITLPMITFTPLFLLLTSPLIVGEFPSLLGLVGVLLIVLGSYALNIKERRTGYLAPFRALFRERGPKLMLLVALLWSVTSNFDKIGVQNSSPFFWVVSIAAFITVVMLPVMLYRSDQAFTDIRRNYKALLPISFFSTLVVLFQMTAISLTLVAYVISIKRTSVIMGVLFGHFLLQEKRVKERLLGAVIMVAGVLCITLS